MNKVLVVENLSKTYPNFKLDDVNFDMPKGHIMGFIGRNGAGKTTTLKSILNLVHVDSGIIRYFDMEITENEEIIKQRIGFASGGVNYYPQNTLEKIANVTSTFYTNWDNAQYLHYMNEFCLDGKKKVKELSEGMKVKFNLVLALSHRAELLILDEPTSGLDPVSRDELLCIFKELAGKGTSILFSTHITSDLDRCADDVTYIKQGKIVASLPKVDFVERFGGGTLEDIMLKIEKDGAL